jgi:ADP-heptose:LPS heptosyltransferase
MSAYGIGSIYGVKQIERKRILMVRTDGIGDALCLAPLVCALRDAGHELGALLSTANAQAFTTRTFEHVHVVERIPWPAHGSTPESYKIARTQARVIGYDIALIASEEPEAYRFAREIHARARIGFVNGWEKPLKSLWTRRRLTRAITRTASRARVCEHEVETLFRLGAGLHHEERPTSDVTRLRPLVAGDPSRLGQNDGVAFQVVAKSARNRTAEEAAIVRAIATAYPVVVVGAAADAALVHGVAAAGGAAERIFDRVLDWREALARMRAVVTADSGAAHVAGMSGVPCVDLFPADKHATRDIERWAPWAGPSRTLIVGPEPSGNARAVVAALREMLEDER